MAKIPHYWRGFIPYGLAALLIGLVGGFSAVLGPAFVEDLGLPYASTTWTALAQAISTAAWAPILGRLGDSLGRRVTLLLGLSVFTLGNALTALANSLGFMLLARFVVGLGTAAIAPVILAYIMTEFPPRATSKGFSAYMLLSSGAVIFGPTLGSLIIQHFGWRSMIRLCTGLCALCLSGCFLTGRQEISRRRPVQDFDGVGALFVVIFFSLALCLPSFGQNLGWKSGAFRLAAAGAVLSCIGLVAAERRAGVPILPGRFLARRAFVFSVLALFLTQGLMQANMTNTIIFVGYTQPGSSTVSGLAISVLYLGMSLGALLLGPLADRHPAKWVLTGSLGLTALGCGLLFFFTTATPLWLLMLCLGILGLGLGGNGTIFLKVVLCGIPAEDAAAGAGTFGLFRDLAAPFGVAVFVPMFTNAITSHIAAGVAPGDAATRALHSLAAVQVLCVAAGAATVWMLPNIRKETQTS